LADLDWSASVLGWLVSAVYAVMEEDDDEEESKEEDKEEDVTV